MRFERIGHGGASVLAPANTLASFDAAREVGVDVIEFDVRAGAGGLVLAHYGWEVRRPDVLRLDTALAHLAGPAFADVLFNVDLKRTGCEAAVLDALGRHGLLERTLISSQVLGILDAVRAREPRARVGISVGGRLARASRRWRGWRAAALAGVAAGRWDALMVQHRLIDASLVEEVAARGGRAYAWTVNDRQGIERLRALGVHGITSGDPRLFAQG